MITRALTAGIVQGWVDERSVLLYGDPESTDLIGKAIPKLSEEIGCDKYYILDFSTDISTTKKLVSQDFGQYSSLLICIQNYESIESLDARRGVCRFILDLILRFPKKLRILWLSTNSKHEILKDPIYEKAIAAELKEFTLTLSDEEVEEFVPRYFGLTPGPEYHEVLKLTKSIISKPTLSELEAVLSVIENSYETYGKKKGFKKPNYLMASLKSLAEIDAQTIRTPKVISVLPKSKVLLHKIKELLPKIAEGDIKEETGICLHFAEKYGLILTHEKQTEVSPLGRLLSEDMHELILPYLTEENLTWFYLIRNNFLEVDLPSLVELSKRLFHPGSFSTQLLSKLETLETKQRRALLITLYHLRSLYLSAIISRVFRREEDLFDLIPRNIAFEGTSPSARKDLKAPVSDFIRSEISKQIVVEESRSLTDPQIENYWKKARQRNTDQIYKVLSSRKAALASKLFSPLIDFLLTAERFELLLIKETAEAKYDRYLSQEEDGVLSLLQVLLDQSKTPLGFYAKLLTLGTTLHFTKKNLGYSEEATNEFLVEMLNLLAGKVTSKNTVLENIRTLKKEIDPIGRYIIHEAGPKGERSWALLMTKLGLIEDQLNLQIMQKKAPTQDQIVSLFDLWIRYLFTTRELFYSELEELYTENLKTCVDTYKSLNENLMKAYPAEEMWKNITRVRNEIESALHEGYENIILMVVDSLSWFDISLIKRLLTDFQKSFKLSIEPILSVFPSETASGHVSLLSGRFPGNNRVFGHNYELNEPGKDIIEFELFDEMEDFNLEDENVTIKEEHHKFTDLSQIPDVNDFVLKNVKSKTYVMLSGVQESRLGQILKILLGDSPTKLTPTETALYTSLVNIRELNNYSLFLIEFPFVDKLGHLNKPGSSEDFKEGYASWLGNPLKLLVEPILKSLRKSGKKSLFIITSDHGKLFGFELKQLQDSKDKTPWDVLYKVTKESEMGKDLRNKGIFVHRAMRYIWIYGTPNAYRDKPKELKKKLQELIPQVEWDDPSLIFLEKEDLVKMYKVRQENEWYVPDLAVTTLYGLGKGKVPDNMAVHGGFSLSELVIPFIKIECG